MEEKLLLQISDRWGQHSFPVDWNKLPDDVLSGIRASDVYTVSCYSPESGVAEKSVVYFRKVKKFRKDITEYVSEEMGIIFGV